MANETVRSTLRRLWLRRYGLALNKPPHMRKILSVEGALGAAEADYLYQAAAQIKEGCIVEIGSFRGKSTVALAAGSQQGLGAPVFAVDPHEPFTGLAGGQFGPGDRAIFFSNMVRTGCAESVRLINLPSQDVAATWSKAIGLLWLDGDHSYEAVLADFHGFSPFVVPGGYIAFHDSLDPDLGPAPVIRQAIAGGDYEKVAQVDLTTVLRKIR